MQKFMIAAALVLLSGSAFAQGLPTGFDPVLPFFKPAAAFNSSVQRTIGDAGTVAPTANAIGAPASIFQIGNADATLTSILLGPIK